VLLKATHFPFIAAIWVYENGADWVAARRRGHALRAMSLSGPDSPTQARRQAGKPTLNSPRAPLAAQDEGVRAGRATLGEADKRRSHQALPEPGDDLKSLVMRLSRQVEELTAVVAAAQSKPRQREGDDEDEG